MLATLKLLLFIEALQITGIIIFLSCLTKEARRKFDITDFALPLAIPIAGLLGHSIYVYYSVLFFIPLLSIGDANKLVKRYLLILVLFPPLDIQLMLGGLYLGSFTGILALNLGALVALVTIRARTRAVARIEIAAWVFFVVALIMATRGIPLGGVARSVVTLTLLVVPPFYVVATCIRTSEAAGYAICGLTLGGACNAVIAVFETYRGWPLYQAFSTALDVPIDLSATLSIRAGFLRAQGPVCSPGTLGLVLAMAILAVLIARKHFRPWGRSLLISLLVLGLVACQSRGTWLAAAVGVTCWVIYERRSLIVAALLVPGAVGARLFYSLLPEDGRLGQLVGRSGAAQSTSEYRSTLLSRGLQEVAAHPFSGQTRDQLQVSMDDLRQGQHIIDFVNTHLFVALTGGIGAFSLWLIAWLVPIGLAWQLRNRNTAHLSDCSLALPFATLCACFACVAVTSLVDRIIPLIMASMGMMSAFIRISLIKKGHSVPSSNPTRPMLVVKPPASEPMVRAG